MATADGLHRTCGSCHHPYVLKTSGACSECGTAIDLEDMTTFHWAIPDPVVSVEGHQLTADRVATALALGGLPFLREETRPVVGPVTSRIVVSGSQKDDVIALLAEADADDATAVTEPWTCGACATEIVPPFTACWNCGRTQQGEQLEYRDEQALPRAEPTPIPRIKLGRIAMYVAVLLGLAIAAAAETYVREARGRFEDLFVAAIVAIIAVESTWMFLRLRAARRQHDTDG